jgi:hypothetical protein
MSLRRLRSGELIALLGAACLVVSFTRRWYSGPRGDLTAWDTFGVAVVLLLVAAVFAVALALANLAERSPALPVALAIWGILFGFLASVAALVRLFERPAQSTSLCAGAWLALAGALLVLVGSWLSIRDERTSLYRPPSVPPRPAP